MSDQDIPRADADRVRLDKWLWAARFYKTRSTAAEAIGGGKVDVNGERAKRAKLLQIGDAIHIRQPPFEIHVVVRTLSERRGRAAEAALLFEETAASRAARATLAAQLRSLPATDRDAGRPTKKERRTLNRWRGR